MANIKVKIDYPITDGSKLKFRTPCESTSVEGLVVTYPVKNGVGYAVKNFTFMDAHGKALSGLGNVFTSDVLIEVLLDVTKGSAYIQNANSNTYIEDIKVTVQRMDEERQTIFADAGKSIEECKEATKKANDAASGVVTIEQNSQDPLRFWVGTREEYEAQKDDTKANTFCIITDDPDEEEWFTNIERDIANNVESITRNTEAIVVNTGAIESNAKAIETHEGAIANNVEAIANNTSAIASNTEVIGVLESGEANLYTASTNEDLDEVLMGVYKDMKNSSIRNIIIQDNAGNTIFGGGNTNFTIYKVSDSYGSIKAIRYYAKSPGEYSRVIMNGELDEWCYVNPSMNPGTEYRTTKKHQGSHVYVKRIISVVDGISINESLATGVGAIVSVKLNYMKDDSSQYLLYECPELESGCTNIKGLYAYVALTGGEAKLKGGYQVGLAHPCTISLDIEYTKG